MSDKPLNVYQKLQKCRVELKTMEIKESGNNKFAGYTYMELGDFLPHIVDLCDKHQLCTVVAFGENATLTIVNSEKPEEQIVFPSPMSTAELKGCHAIQNLGAVETYLRRYLYVNAFDIVEHDALDNSEPTVEREKPERYTQGSQNGVQSDKVTPAQVKMLIAKIKGMGADEGAFKAHFGVKELADLPKAKMNSALDFIAGK